MPLARRVALRYAQSGEAIDDLAQVAYLGLVKAIDRYDPSRGTAFTSYAIPTITGEVRRHLRDHGWSVRPPRDLQERALTVHNVREDLGARLGRSPTVQEVGVRLGLSDAEVLEAVDARRARYALSLAGPASQSEGDDAMTLGDTCGVEEDGYDRVERRALLDELARVLTDRERIVLRLRCEEDLTQAAIGERVGISQMQVSRLLRQAQAKLARAAAPSAA
jgi:RNA polymerase sigma-B factor